MTLNERRFTMPEGLAELQARLESRWPAMQARLRASGVPLNDETPEEKEARERAERDAAATAAAAAAAADKSFSQADVDRIVQERLARAKTTPPDDYEELKAAKAELDKIRDGEKTELQKAQERAQQLERERDEAQTSAKETRLRSAIVAEAAKKGVSDPQDAIALIDRSKLQLDDDGNPTNIAEAMEALLEAKPYLAGGGNDGRVTGNGNADQGARGGGSGKQLASTEGMTPDQIAEAVARGELDEYLKTKK